MAARATNKSCDRPLGVCSAQRMRNSVVDRADDEKYCFGSRRKWKILLWSAHKMINTLVDRVENEKIVLWIAKKTEHTVVVRAENEKYCRGPRRK